MNKQISNSFYENFYVKKTFEVSTWLLFVSEFSELSVQMKKFFLAFQLFIKNYESAVDCIKSLVSWFLEITVILLTKKNNNYFQKRRFRSIFFLSFFVYRR